MEHEDVERVVALHLIGKEALAYRVGVEALCLACSVRVVIEDGIKYANREATGEGPVLSIVDEYVLAWSWGGDLGEFRIMGVGLLLGLNMPVEIKTAGCGYAECDDADRGNCLLFSHGIPLRCRRQRDGCAAGKQANRLVQVGVVALAVGTPFAPETARSIVRP